VGNFLKSSPCSPRIRACSQHPSKLIIRTARDPSKLRTSIGVYLDWQITLLDLKKIKYIVSLFNTFEELEKLFKKFLDFKRFRDYKNAWVLIFGEAFLKGSD